MYQGSAKQMSEKKKTKEEIAKECWESKAELKTELAQCALNWWKLENPIDYMKWEKEKKRLDSGTDETKLSL